MPAEFLRFLASWPVLVIALSILVPVNLALYHGEASGQILAHTIWSGLTVMALLGGARIALLIVEKIERKKKERK